MARRAACVAGRQRPRELAAATIAHDEREPGPVVSHTRTGKPRTAVDIGLMASILILLVVRACGSAQAAGQPNTLENVREWIQLLANHRVGTLDDTAIEASRWEWIRLGPMLEELRRRARPDVILRSAAMLSDIAIAIPVSNRPLGNVRGTTLAADDGQLRGGGVHDGHVAAARQLLDALPRKEEPDAALIRADVITWYRAMAAWMASTHNLADLEYHVERAVSRFDDDAGILFDAACFHETFASPLAQLPLAAAAESSRNPHSNAIRTVPASTRLATAESYYNRAVARDPSLVEARVRLGRVLVLRQRAKEAVGVLGPTAGGGPDGITKYFGWMFFGDALAGTGADGEAIRAFESAAALYPHAASPQLAISQIAAERGNQTLARAALERVYAAADKPPDADPWLDYTRCNGRNAAAALQAFRDRARDLPAADPDDWRVR